MTKDEKFTKELQKYRDEKANVLLPSTRIEGLSDWHEPVIDQVFLDPDTESGDVYVQQQGNKNNPTKYAITKQGLMKLSACAGIMWHPTECRRTDSRSDKNYVSFQAVGGVRKADGTPIFMKAEYDLDFDVIEDELEEQYRNKAEGYEGSNKAEWWHKMNPDEKEAYIQKCIRRDLLQKRKHKMKLAESGAMNRVVRALLGLKGTYKKAELEKPFVMARIVIKPDFNDKEVRKAMIDASIKSMTSVYGGTTEFPKAELPPENKIIDLPVEDEDPLNDDSDPDLDPDSLRQDFIDSDKDTQIYLLEELINGKGYDKNQLKRPLDKFKDEDRLGFYDLLISMPDNEDDDIPWQ